jgi:hypothetical protein
LIWTSRRSVLSILSAQSAKENHAEICRLPDAIDLPSFRCAGSRSTFDESRLDFKRPARPIGAASRFADLLGRLFAFWRKIGGATVFLQHTID